MTTEAVTGFSWGMMILKNVWNGPQPSMAAASSRAMGMLLIKLENRKMLVGSWKVSYVTIMPQ